MDWLREHGWLVDVTFSEHDAHAKELAAEAAAAGYDCVVACGGDGILNAVLNGLAGSSTALAIVAGGTTNVWAREISLPDNAAAALRLVATGERRRADAATVGGRRFLLMASIGLDSLVVAGGTRRWKRPLSQLSYGADALWRLRDYAGFIADVSLDGERFEVPAVAFVAGNTRSYGALLQITRLARIDDGLLDVSIHEGSGPQGFLAHLAGAALGRNLAGGRVYYRQVQRIEIATETPLPIQADGEIVGATPATIEVIPDAVTLVVPPGLRSPLWQQEPEQQAR